MNNQMIKRKPRLLIASEASFLKTGFAKINLELLKRLHERGNIEVAELGSYAKTSDPRARELPWRFYGGIPEDADQFSHQRANSSHFQRVYGQFGATVFEQVCLDFKPDAVFCDTDQWMSSAWQLHSPYREYFKYILCPTIDGLPQRLPWLDDYARADVLMTYSRFGQRALQEQSPSLRVFDVLAPGVNTDIFSPMDKEQAREKLGISSDSKIILSVMRNQKRKLFPDLIESFSAFIKHCIENGNKELADKSYLYLHTSNIDVGYDIQHFMMKEGVGHKILLSYLCRNCGHFEASFYKKDIAACPRCHKLAMFMPNTGYGISDKQLALLYNASDVYVQMSTCEGLSMTPIEARSCGIPAFCTDYSATSDQAHEPGGFPINVDSWFYEPVIETEQRRAMPSQKHLVSQLYWFFGLTDQKRSEIGKAGREYVCKNYSFDRSADILEKAVQSLEFPDHSLTWMNPIRKQAPMRQDLPPNLTNSEFVDWCIKNILGQNKWLTTYWRDDIITSLSNGTRKAEGSGQMYEFTRERCWNMMMDKAKDFNMFDNLRVSQIIGSNNRKAYEVI